MTQMIFVNLPVKDLEASKAFYTAIGAELDERFCDDSAAMVRFSEEICVMLLTHARFSDFTDKAIIDAHTQVQVLNCLSRDSRDAVDATVKAAGAAGGKMDPGPVQEYGFMYGRGFADPDGHVWELAWMDMDAAMASRKETV